MYESKNLDHLGLVAGMCDELGLVSLIDNLLPSDSTERKVSTGVCVKALILNGLGFVGRRLYLVSDFFSDKPVEHLLGAGITSDLLNDDRLGRCLDDLYSFGLTEIFSIIAANAYIHLGLSSLPQFAHADSSSFHVDGAYNSDTYQEGDACIHITQGYSRDHRPDLNQVCLNMIVENSAGIPLFMEALSGNSSDKKSLAQSIESFSKSLQSAPNPLCWVADSALYSAENIKTLSKTGLWLTRVPETISAVKYLKEAIELGQMQHFAEKDLADYRYQILGSTYGGVRQEWLLIFSQNAYQREAKSLTKSFAKASLAESKAVEQLCKKTFACKQDAQNALAQLQCKYIQLHDTSIEAIEGYAGKGKPKPNEAKIIKGYQIKVAYSCPIDQYVQKQKTLGFFVLASNEVEGKLSPDQKLSGYKDQNKVEKGFRFLKDPDFHAATMFVKKPPRVEAVLMLMTLCLLVYAALERQLRQALQEQNQTLPNQNKKEVHNPTMKWVFMLFRGIHCLYLPDQKKPVLLNIKAIHLKIIALFAHNIAKYYKIE
jgi:transposase